MTRATGLSFIVEGATDEVPRAKRPQQDPRYGDRSAPVLVAWTTPAVVPELAGPVAGIGGSTAYAGTGGPRLVTGIVALDAPALTGIMAKPQGWGSARAIVLHELGHLVGLAHVPDRSQLMAPRASTQVTFAAGDLRGLHELGLGRCYLDT